MRFAGTERSLPRPTAEDPYQLNFWTMLTGALKYLLISFVVATFGAGQVWAAEFSSPSQTTAAPTAGASVPQGDISPAQSGPGAVGLFTPSSPGNAAAYNAQLHGGLEGSPIVDGTGSNMVVKVPYASPSGEAAYEQITTSGANAASGTGANARSDGTSANASALGPSRFFNTPAAASAARGPNSAGAGNRQLAPNEGNAFSIHSGAESKLPPSTGRPPSGASYRVSQHKSYVSAPAARRHNPPRVKSSGLIQYADGQTVRFGVGESARP